MQRLYKKNKGAITLLISVIILTLLGIVTLYTVKVNVMDQRMVANEADYQEAFTMAEAGLDFAVQQLFTDVFNNPTSDEHLEYSITRRKTDGSPASETEAGFAVKIGCKRGDADEIVPCSHDDILRPQSTYIKDGGLDADYAPTEIPGAPIYNIESTGYSANGSSEVTVRRQMTMKPLLNGVSSVSLIVDGEVDTGNDGRYHIRPSYSGDEPIAIWASGNVYMRNESAICTRRARLDDHNDIPGDRAWRDDSLADDDSGGTGSATDGRGCWDMPDNIKNSLLKEIKIVGAYAPIQPDRYCTWEGVYARAGTKSLRDISEITTRWEDGCATSIGVRRGDDNSLEDCPNCASEDLETIDSVTADKREDLTPNSRNVVLGNGDTRLESYDDQGIYRGVLPNAGAFVRKSFPTDLFAYTFGVPRADWKMIRAKAKKKKQVKGDCHNDFLNSRSGEYYALWWITGNCIMSNNQKIGRSSHPVILVIEDARLEMTKNNIIYGRVFLFDKPHNHDKPSANFNFVSGNSPADDYPRIIGGLTSDVGNIITSDTFIIDSYRSSRYPYLMGEGLIGGGVPDPILAERQVGRNHDIVAIPGSWYDY